MDIGEKMVRKRKTLYPGHEWRKIFGSIAKWCARNKSPGEPMAVCIKKAVEDYKAGKFKVPVV